MIARQDDDVIFDIERPLSAEAVIPQDVLRKTAHNAEMARD